MVSSLVLQTSTLSGGGKTTITSFASVGGTAANNGGGAATPTGGAGASGTGPAPGLQSASAEKKAVHGAGMAAFGVAALAAIL